MRIFIALIALLMSYQSAYAQDVPKPRMMFIQGGVLCDTEEELQTLLTGISLARGQWPENVPAGCGRFVPRTPVPMMVTPMYWYQTPLANTLVAHFHYQPNGWEQWGWIAYEPAGTPPTEPTGEPT